MTYSPRLHATCSGVETHENLCMCCCFGCTIHCALHREDHDLCQKPSRAWWYQKDSWDWGRWQFVYFGGDEWCNRTIVLRLWKPLVIALNIPLRRESCEECLETYLRGVEKE